MLALAAAATAGQSIQVNFAAPVVTATTAAPGVWFIDRYPTCVFTSPVTAPDGIRNTLEESICASGVQETPFYNTQGRGYFLVAKTYSTSIELYVPSSWRNENARLAGFWGIAVDSSGNVEDYPIIEFQGPITSQPSEGPSYYPNGGVAGFYGWNDTTDAWEYIGLPPGFTYDSWVKLTITMIPGIGFEYSVENPTSRRGLSISSPASDLNDVALHEVILEGYNYGANQNIFWNDLTMSFSSSTRSILSGTPNFMREHQP